MTKRSLVIGGLALLGLWSVGVRPAAASPQEANVAPAEAVDCGACHEQQVKDFALNPHARKRCEPANSNPVVCTGCHGDGKDHAEAGGDKSLIRGMKGREGSAQCVTCHRETKDHQSFKTGSHASTEAVHCQSCHSIHKPHAKAQKLLAKPETEICATCHSNVVAGFKNKPYAHRLGRTMECSSCHEPHGRPGKEMMKETSAGEAICLSCHAEKRGPYVFPHVQDSAGSCQSCHQPHGSNNPKQLIRPQIDKLCLECHSNLGGAAIGSQPPSIHNTTLARWKNCTVCHTAVHGSNRSPQLLR